MHDRIYLSSPHMGGNEINYVQKAFATNWVSPVGPQITSFEKKISNYTGVPHTAALNSGTSAIHLALICLGVKTGDEVICQSFTFSASANPILYQKANPVFVDSEETTWNMSPELLEEAILDRIKKRKKIKAIIPVHLYGMPYMVDEVHKIADHFEIPVIEDAAEALGSKYNGKLCGSFGDIAVLSFNGNKIITTSGGGALLSENMDYVEKAKFLATQARDPAPHYEHSQIGYNYRLSNVSAGIGLGQMEVLNQRIAQRRVNFDYYFQHLSSVPGISFLPEPEGYYSNRWLTCIIVDPLMSGGVTNHDIRLALEEKNIESRPLWKPMHLQPVFTGRSYYGANCADSLFQNGLCLPSGSNLTLNQLELTVSIIKDTLDA